MGVDSDHRATAEATRDPSRGNVFAARHFPFLQLAQFVGFACVLYCVGRALSGMDVPVACAYIVWGLAVLVLLPLLGLQRTTLVLDPVAGTLDVTWRAWWGGMVERSAYPLEAIRAIRLTDERRTYRHGDETLLHGVVFHNWRLWAVLSDDDQVPLLPRGHGSGLFDQGFGKRLAQALGVPFRKETWERHT